MAGSVRSSHALVIAHRGLRSHGYAHGNTLGALDRAARMGADVLEFDLRRTRDGVIVLHHDAALADGRHIAKLGFDELAGVRIDGEPIPTLRQALDLANRHRLPVAIELKEAGYEADALAQILAQVPRERLVAIETFLPQSVGAIKRFDEAIPVSLQFYRRQHLLFPERAIDQAARVGADMVALHHRRIGERVLRRAAEREMPLLAYTVNDARTMARLLADPRVRGVYTDDTALGLATRAQVLSGG